MSIEQLNMWPAGRASAALHACADIDAWVDDLVTNRPFPDVAALLDRAVQAATQWTDAEVEHALADHPRIGDRHPGEGAAAEHSRGEQAGVADDTDLTNRLADGNRRYEQRFGRVYLVRAAGRSGEEMLALLEQRLGNDDATEHAETKAQLAEIAVLRLHALVIGDPGEDAV